MTIPSTNQQQYELYQARMKTQRMTQRNLRVDFAVSLLLILVVLVVLAAVTTALIGLIHLVFHTGGSL